MDAKKESKLLGHKVTVEKDRYSVAIGGKVYSGPVHSYDRERLLRRARAFLRQAALLEDVPSDHDKDENQSNEDK